MRVAERLACQLRDANLQLGLDLRQTIFKRDGRHILSIEWDQRGSCDSLFLGK
jgi:hypothetical protein